MPKGYKNDGTKLVPPNCKGKKKPPRTKEHIEKLSKANFKGDMAGKSAMHIWVVNKKGRPLECSFCRKFGGSYRLYDWANKYHTYKRKLEDYIRLCKSCHRKYDIKNNNYVGFWWTNGNPHPTKKK